MLAIVVVLGVGVRLATRPDASGGTAAAPQGVTATVERRPLRASVIVRGRVVVVDEVTVTAPPRPDGQVSSVVTAAPLEPNASIASGRPLLEVNGRPIVAMAMRIPLYRDIVAGTTGPDVAALRDELGRLGYDTSGDAPGAFGPATQDAVDELFGAAGYEAGYSAGTRADYEAGIAAAQGAIDEALTEANRSRAAGTIDPSLEGAVDEAIAARDRYRASMGVMVRVGEIAQLPAPTAAVVGSVPRVGASFAPGDALLTVALPKPEARVALSPAQASTVTADTRISLAGSGYSASCEPGQLIAADAVETGPAGSTPAGSDGAAGDDTTTSSPSGDQDGATDRSSSSDLELAVACDPPPALEQVGADYRATLTTDVAGEHLVVPVTAIVTAPDGRAYVRVQQGDRTLRRTPVTVVAEAGGFVALDASKGALDAGDQVRVSNG